MSRAISKRSWGPSHQQMKPPFERGLSLPWKLAGLFALAFFVHGIVDPRGPAPIQWCLKALVLGWLATLLLAAIADGRIPIRWLWSLLKRTEAAGEPATADVQDKTPGEA